MMKARGRGPEAVRLSILLAGMLGAARPCAFALDMSLDISQYAHTAWRVRDGFTKGAISTIAQTPDGYFWLGTDFGLLRFDGIRAVPWQPPPAEIELTVSVAVAYAKWEVAPKAKSAPQSVL